MQQINRPPGWVRLLLLFFTLGGFGLRLHELTRQDIWWDEARNIDVALRPFWQIPTAPELDIHPPIYFWLLHLWCRLFGLGDSTQLSVAALASPIQLTFITRSFSAFAGVLGVALSIGLVRRWRGASALAIAGVGFLTAFSAFWLAESQETRMYTLSFMWLMAGAAVLLWATDRNAPRQLPLFALFGALALLTHYNALFILLSWYLWWGTWALLQSQRWLWLRRVVGTGLLMSILLVPIVPIALRQIPGYRNPNLTIPTIGAYLWENWQAYLGGNAFSGDLLRVGERSVGIQWLWAVAILLFLGLIITIFRALANKKDGKRESKLYLSFYLVWLLGGLGLYYIAVVDRGAFNPRYSSFVTPALYVLIAVCLSSWQGLKGQNPLGRYLSWGLAIGTFLMVGVGFGPAISADLYDNHFAREAMQQTSSWLRENAGPNDLILVDQKYPFGFYYERFSIDSAQVPVQAPAPNLSSQEAAPARYLFVDINTIDQRLNQWASQAKRIFWVQWYESDTDPRNAVSFLLDKHGQWQGEKAFRGYTVDWWALTPPTTFDLAPNMVAATYIFPPAVETAELSLPQHSFQPGELLPIAIRWKRVTVGEIDRPLKARIALYRPGSESRKAQDDRPLLNDRHLMPAEWGRDDSPINVYALLLAADLESGLYEARLLVYDAETLEPLTYVDLAGNPAGVEALIGTFTIE